MGKQGKLRKRRRLALESQHNIQHNIFDDDLSEDNDVTSADLSTTIKTLEKILSCEDSSFVSNSKYKYLRSLLYKFQNDKLVATGKSLSGQVSDTLRDHKWPQTLLLLNSIRQTNSVPKLGALQRWVRECDAAESNDPLVIQVLDSILRTADPSQIPLLEPTDEPKVRDLKKGDILLKDAWSYTESAHHDYNRHRNLHGSTVTLESRKNNIEDGEREEALKKFRLVGIDKGIDRKPPNKYDIFIYQSLQNAVTMTKDWSTIKVNIPTLPGVFFMPQVLTGDECRQIIDLSESIGYLPDTPLNDQRSVLAHNFVWCADDALWMTIFERCRPHLPPSINGKALLGINCRWRLYRYVPGAIYRPHIDGAWPWSGVREDENGDMKYIYDMYGDRWSKLTFLLYLNDDFEGGQTTFFTPSFYEGCLDAQPVVPRAGGVLVFPHGETQGSLLHEGTGVLKGAKYIIRSDVLYAA